MLFGLNGNFSSQSSILKIDLESSILKTILVWTSLCVSFFPDYTCQGSRLIQLITDSFLLSLGTRTWGGKQNDRGSIQKFGEEVQKTCAKERVSIGEAWLQESRKHQEIFIYLVSTLPYGQPADSNTRLCYLPSSLFFPRSLFYGQNCLQVKCVYVYNQSFFLSNQSVSLICSLCLWQKYIDNSIWDLLSEQCYQITAKYDTFLHILPCLFQLGCTWMEQKRLL